MFLRQQNYHQRGDTTMAQGALPFKYEEQRQGGGMTALAGLPIYLDLAQVMGLSKSAEQHLAVRAGRGWTDAQVVTSLVLLNLAGGDRVDDLDILEADEGFCRVLRRTYMQGMSRQARRSLERRWVKEGRRSVPSPSAVFRYLSAFHDSEQDKYRQPGKALIPTANEHLRGFAEVNRDFLAFVQKNNPEDTATLDTDATLLETNKLDALFCYKSFKAYQPINTWWFEQAMVVHTEFRDGNVPAGYEQLRVFKEALSLLPEGIKTVQMRSDTAGYQHNLLRYCEMGENKRFGRIEFAVGCDVTPEFKKAVSEVCESEWQPVTKKVKGKEVDTGKQWAEVCFVPNAIGHSKNGPEYRYIATRELMEEQLTLTGMEDNKQYPFQTMPMKQSKYKVFGIVTNMDREGNELIRWLYQRCGKSEEAHSVMKQDLAGGKLPSGDFGENAAWWWIMMLALNLNAAMKRLVLGQSWVPKRMKAIRFSLINLAAQVVDTSRYLLVRLSKGNRSLKWLLDIRAKIAMLSPVLAV
jgi:hypothetical protein